MSKLSQITFLALLAQQMSHNLHFCKFAICVFCNLCIKGPFRDLQPHPPIFLKKKKLGFLHQQEALGIMFMCKIFFANSFVCQNNWSNCDMICENLSHVTQSETAK